MFTLVLRQNEAKRNVERKAVILVGIPSRTADNPFEIVPEVRMIVGERLRILREQKKLSQGDIEKKTIAPLLHFESRERPHRSRSGNS